MGRKIYKDFLQKIREDLRKFYQQNIYDQVRKLTDTLLLLDSWPLLLADKAFGRQ